MSLRVKEARKDIKRSSTLRADVYINSAPETYLGPFWHFISEDYQKTLKPASTYLEERHSSENLMTCLEEVVAKFDIMPTEIKPVVRGKEVVSETWMMKQKIK